MPKEDTYPLPRNEKKRLKALYDYHILDTIPEKEYDAITKIAAAICNVPASLITLLDKDRQWFKSSFGFQIKETPRAISFCNYTIVEPENILVVPDLRIDKRFATNPLVTGEPHAVFYAGAPLVTTDGFVLGSICVLDGKVNNLDEDQRAALQALANQIVTKMELHKKIHELTVTREKLKKANGNLKNFARIVSHDMKTPIANILMMSRSVQSTKGVAKNKKALGFLDLIDNSTKELLRFIEEILIKSEKIEPGNLNNQVTDSGVLLNQVIKMIALPSDIRIKRAGKFPKLKIDKTCLQQVFQNIIINAIKYNDKKQGIIIIHSFSDSSHHHFIFDDNGLGIDKKYLSKVLTGGKIPRVKDRYGSEGTGLGLATINRTIKKIGGKFCVTSKKRIGSSFKVSFPFNSIL